MYRSSFLGCRITLDLIKLDYNLEPSIPSRRKALAIVVKSYTKTDIKFLCSTQLSHFVLNMLWWIAVSQFALGITLTLTDNKIHTYNHSLLLLNNFEIRKLNSLCNQLLCHSYPAKY